MRRGCLIALFSLTALLLAACGTDDDTTVAGEPTPTTEDGTVDGGLGDDLEERGAVDGSDPILDPQVQEAIADVAATTGVEATDVEVVTAELVTWSDGSLGCPDPDMMYTQALVDGYRIVLDVDGEQVHYHGADGDVPFRCDTPQEPAEQRPTS